MFRRKVNKFRRQMAFEGQEGQDGFKEYDNVIGFMAPPPPLSTSLLIRTQYGDKWDELIDIHTVTLANNMEIESVKVERGTTELFFQHDKNRAVIEGNSVRIFPT